MAGVVLVVTALIITVNCVPSPGGNHHVRHRIHVPQKIKTVYHTKIVKVPEHHHYFHEKEKIITIPVKKNKHEVSFNTHEASFTNLDDNQDWDEANDFTEDEHNLFKKHVSHTSFFKDSASQKIPRVIPSGVSYAKTTVPKNSNARVKPPNNPSRSRSKSRNSRPNRASLAGKTNNNSKNNRPKPKQKPKRTNDESYDEHYTSTD